MKLSLINNETLTDAMIDKIVYSDTDDNLKNTNYGIVLGNSMLIKERVNTAYDAYRSGRIKKLYLVVVLAGLVIKITILLLKQ